MTTVDRTLLASRLHREATDATLKGDVHEADRWVTSMTRPELEALRTHMLTLRELIDNRLEELDLRDQAGGTYHQPRREYPGMDDGGVA